MLRYAKISPTATDPVRKHPSDAGFDVFASESVQALPGRGTIVHTGITVEIPEGYCLQAWPKGSSDHLVGAGIFDAGYQGEVLIKVFNTRKKIRIIRIGEPVAQLVLIRIDTPALQEVPIDKIHATETERGATGGIVNQIRGTGGRLVG